MAAEARGVRDDVALRVELGRLSHVGSDFGCHGRCSPARLVRVGLRRSLRALLVGPLGPLE
eukprot:9117271-Lingulodinium_polyedra.AAC.1